MFFVLRFLPISVFDASSSELIFVFVRLRRWVRVRPMGSLCSTQSRSDDGATGTAQVLVLRALFRSRPS